ncbi:MAG: hypothetical protein D6711_02285, partial [Chloroflexi bacterium]
VFCKETNAIFSCHSLLSVIVAVGSIPGVADIEGKTAVVETAVGGTIVIVWAMALEVGGINGRSVVCTVDCDKSTGTVVSWTVQAEKVHSAIKIK